MYRSYFFTLFSCAVFSIAALLNGYYGLLDQASPNTASALDTSPSPSLAISEGKVEIKDFRNQRETPVLAEKPSGEKATPEEDDRDSSNKDEKGKRGTWPGEQQTCQLPGSFSRQSSVDPAADWEQSLVETVDNGLPSIKTENPPEEGKCPSGDTFSRAGSIPLNSLTDNFNILLLGVDGDKLEMTSVYSINHHLKTRPKSVSLFFPINSVLQYKGRKRTLDSIFSSGGWQAIAEAVENEMYIDIDYYVKIDRQALRNLEKYFDPIYVDGEKVEMETLFVRRTSSADDRIIAQILKQVLRPEMFFRLIPGMVFGIHKDIESNFSFTPRNLAFYYRLARKLSAKRIEKIVLFGDTDWENGRKVNIPPEDGMQSAIYLATRP